MVPCAVRGTIRVTVLWLGTGHGEHEKVHVVIFFWRFLRKFRYEGLRACGGVIGHLHGLAGAKGRSGSKLIGKLALIFPQPPANLQVPRSPPNRRAHAARASPARRIPLARRPNSDRGSDRHLATSAAHAHAVAVQHPPIPSRRIAAAFGTAAQSPLAKCRRKRIRHFGTQSLDAIHRSPPAVSRSCLHSIHSCVCCRCIYHCAVRSPDSALPKSLEAPAT